MRETLLSRNDETYWVPETIREGRFANWLKDARDWNISRSRYALLFLITLCLIQVLHYRKIKIYYGNSKNANDNILLKLSGTGALQFPFGFLKMD